MNNDPVSTKDLRVSPPPTETLPTSPESSLASTAPDQTPVIGIDESAESSPNKK